MCHYKETLTHCLIQKERQNKMEVAAARQQNEYADILPLQTRGLFLLLSLQ